MVKMVVFDLDGTLVNSLVDLGIATNEGLKKAGLPVQPMKNYNHFVGNGREMLVKRAMGEGRILLICCNVSRYLRTPDMFHRLV